MEMEMEMEMEIDALLNINNTLWGSRKKLMGGFSFSCGPSLCFGCSGVF